MVREAMAEDPDLTLNTAVHRIGSRVGVVPDTLRDWGKHNAAIVCLARRRIDVIYAMLATASTTKLVRAVRDPIGTLA